MCTLCLAWGVFPDAPTVIAANRDEGLSRPSEPPAYHADGIDGAVCPGTNQGQHPRNALHTGPRSAEKTSYNGDRPAVLTPRDSRAGGTWIGINDAGVSVGITNRWSDAGPEGERSRGLLVADCLACDSAETAVKGVEQTLRECVYSPFNLVIADRRAAFLVEWDGTIAVNTLSPGIHVIVNVGGVLNGRGRFSIPSNRTDGGQRQQTSAYRLWETLRPEPGTTPDAWVEHAGEILGDHEFGVCVHEEGFGTRSSSLIQLSAGDGPALERTRYQYADGPPCETAFEVPTN